MSCHYIYGAVSFELPYRWRYGNSRRSIETVLATDHVRSPNFMEIPFAVSKLWQN